MTDQRVGRHVRIYEWDEVDIEEAGDELPEMGTAVTAKGTHQKVQAEEPSRLRKLLKRKLF